MELRIRQVEVRDAEGVSQWGLLAEGEGGRMLLGLFASSEADLLQQVDDAGGAAAWLRRFGAAPLDPEGITVGPGGAIWVEPA